MGDNVIHYGGHVRMMAAVQPFLSGAISKTVNMPEDATVEDIEQIHIDAWKMGIKAIAIYRDNCKVGQPLSTMKKAGSEADDAASGAVSADPALAAKVAELEEMLAATTTWCAPRYVNGCLVVVVPPRQSSGLLTAKDLSPLASLKMVVLVSCSSRCPSRVPPWQASWMRSR
jgi:ribonucleotide reductase alpha subunit